MRNPNRAPTALGADEQRIVVRVHARFEVDDAIGAAHDWIEHLADPATDDEVCAEIVHAVDAQHDARRQLLLIAEVELLDRRVLQRVVDDVDARRAGAGEDEPGEGIGRRRRKRRELAGRSDRGRRRCRREPRLAARDRLARVRAIRSRASRDRSRCRSRHECSCGRPSDAQLKPMRGPKLFRSFLRSPWRNGCTIGLISS